MSLRHVDLFAGVGGFHQGWHTHRVETVWASEWNASSAETYTKNYQLTPAGDITAIAASEVPSHDILSAGFPCQAFSVSGKQRGFADTRGTLFFDVVRIIRHHRTPVILLENVKNFARHDNGNTLTVVEDTLTALGYTVQYQVLPATSYNVPQHRERIYIVGFLNPDRAEKFTFPTPVPLTRSVGDIMDSVADPAMIVTRTDITLNHARIAEYDALSAPVGRPLRVGSVGKGGQGNRIYHHKGAAITLSAYGGGTGARTGLYYTPQGDIRKLTSQEAFRAMGFPSTFVPHSSRTQALHHAGNAVVVPVVEAIAGNILATL